MPAGKNLPGLNEDCLPYEKELCIGSVMLLTGYYVESNHRDTHPASFILSIQAIYQYNNLKELLKDQPERNGPVITLICAMKKSLFKNRALQPSPPGNNTHMKKTYTAIDFSN